MGSDDFLRLHTYSGHNQRLAFILYLTPDWRPEFGGALCLLDAAGVPTRVDARFNRLALFDVAARSRHYVEPIRPEAGGLPRLTVGGWFDNPSPGR
jgi:Rps23 Pro-64 3,4-dihydroxylase Tpa1-like proline 4-hydroxylase